MRWRLKKRWTWRDFVWDNPSEALNLATTRLMYQAAANDIVGAGLDLAEYAPLGVGALVEGGRDINGILFTQDRELRHVVDKWRNYGILGIIGGKGAKKAAGEVFEVVSSVGSKAAIKDAALREAQRKTGNVGRFKDLTKCAPTGGLNDGKQVHYFPTRST